MSPGAPWVLVLAGRDPTRGAGVDADGEATRSAGVEARAVVTAETQQDGVQVQAVLPRTVETWLGEARALLEGAPAVIKTGLLPGAEHVRAVARLLDEARGVTAVVDPVLAASGGETFLDAAGREALCDELLPRGVVLTPNLGEAARLVGREEHELAAPEAREAAARELCDRGARAVLLKGGHGNEDPVRDLVLEPGGAVRWVEHPRVRGAGLHGSGCRYASRVAAELARGRDLVEAAAAAGAWVAELIRARAAGAVGHP